MPMHERLIPVERGEAGAHAPRMRTPGDRLRRRTALAAVLYAPVLLRAQSLARVPRIAVLRWGQPGDDAHRGLPAALAAIGYHEGNTIHTEWRFAQSREQANRHAAELVAMAPDLLVGSATPAAQALRDATKSIPIVLAAAADPVGAGLVRSMAQPGGNITGVSNNLTAIVPKQVQLLRELLPALRRVAFLGSSEDVATPVFRDRFRDGVEALGLERHEVLVARADEFAAAADAMLRARSQAVVVQPLFVLGDARPLAEVLVQRRLPAVTGLSGFVRSGGLLSYGAHRAETWRASAHYIDRVLKGARPDTLPIVDPQVFELALNLATARALGLTVPRALQLRADEVVG